LHAGEGVTIPSYASAISEQRAPTIAEILLHLDHARRAPTADLDRRRRYRQQSFPIR
jgi:hypothetical protein